MAPNRDAIETFLGGLPAFAELRPPAIRYLAHSGTEYQVPRGTVVFRQGEPCSGLHIVVDGQVKLYFQTADGQEKVVELAGPGRILGEAALVLDRTYLMTVEAIADTSLVQLAKDAVLDQINYNSSFLRCLLREACRGLDQRTRDLESCLLLNGTQRVTGFLLSQLPPNGAAGRQAIVTLPAQKSIIASRLNLTHEHFSRILHEIQNAGLIEVRGRQIRFIDVARLRGDPQ